MDEVKPPPTIVSTNEASRRTPKNVRRLALLTAGGDAPGMNAAAGVVVRTAGGGGIEVMGVRRGFEGLIYGNFEPLANRAVSNIIQRGGTILETSRSPQFAMEAARARAAENLTYRGVNGLVVIGGDGRLFPPPPFSSASGTTATLFSGPFHTDVPTSDYATAFHSPAHPSP